MSILSNAKSFVVKQATKVSIAVAKNMPGISFAIGVVSVIGGTVYVAASSSKADAIMDDFDRRMNQINDTIKAAEETGEPEKHYPVATQVANKRLVYGHMIMSMAKLYIPAIALEAFGIFCLCKSRKMYKERIGSLSAAFAAQTKMFNEYRKRVRSRLGEQEENDIFYNVHTVEVVEKETGENGVTTEVKKTKEVSESCDIFAELFTIEDNPWGYKDPYAILNAIDESRRQMNQIIAYKKAPFGKQPFLTRNEMADVWNRPNNDAWSTFVTYRDPKNPEESVQFSIGPAELNNVEGTERWKFINRITDGIWVTPNIQANICDDLKTQYSIARLNEEMHKINEKKKALFQ